MKIEDDLKMHSHYIEDLFRAKTETSEVIEAIKERMIDMKEKIGIHSYAHSVQDETMAKVLENQKDFKEILDKLNCKTYEKFYLYEIFKDILSSPKNWFLTVGFIIVIELTIGFSGVLKHFLRLG